MHILKLLHLTCKLYEHNSHVTEYVGMKCEDKVNIMCCKCTEVAVLIHSGQSRIK